MNANALRTWLDIGIATAGALVAAGTSGLTSVGCTVNEVLISCAGAALPAKAIPIAAGIGVGLGVLRLIVKYAKSAAGLFSAEKPAV